MRIPLLLIALCLAACGQSGALVHPDAQPAAVPVAPTTTVVPLAEPAPAKTDDEDPSKTPVPAAPTTPP